jgi:hypothetical protein
MFYRATALLTQGSVLVVAVTLTLKMLVSTQLFLNLSSVRLPLKKKLMLGGLRTPGATLVFFVVPLDSLL